MPRAQRQGRRQAGHLGNDGGRGIALALAREQGAKLWELRAATSLARLSRSSDKAAAARESLATVYRSFSEGFTTPDLEQAKAALDALA